MSARQTRSSRPLGDVSVNIVQRATAGKRPLRSGRTVKTTTKGVDDGSGGKENGASFDNTLTLEKKRIGSNKLARNDAAGPSEGKATSTIDDSSNNPTAVMSTNKGPLPEGLPASSEGALACFPLEEDAPVVVVASSGVGAEMLRDAPLDLSVASLPTCAAEYRSGDIVWAKVKGFPWWPAKVAEVNEAKDAYGVVFFGTRESGCCKGKDLQSYGTEGSSAPAGKLKTHAYMAAVREADAALGGTVAIRATGAAPLQSQSLGYTAGSDQPRKKLSKAEKQRRAEEFELGRVAEEERLRKYFAELDNQPTKVEFD